MAEPTTSNDGKRAIMFIGRASTVHIGYLKAASDARAAQFSSIVVVSDKWTSDAQRVDLLLKRSWGLHMVESLVLDQHTDWHIPNLRQLPSIPTQTIRKIYGIDYVEKSSNILTSLEKVLQFSLVSKLFPSATMFLGQNERSHYFLFRRTFHKNRLSASFSELTPSLRGAGRMSSERASEALLLSDQHGEAHQKIMRAVTSPLSPSESNRSADCQLLRSVKHILPAEPLGRIEAQCRSGRACQNCKFEIAELITEFILIDFD